MKTNNFTEFFRKYSFYIGIGVLTIILVFIFRHKKLGDLVEEGKKGLASLYTKDLRPMIYSNEITNEDVFNFAMFNSLPVNKKENKFLYISQDSLGQNAISFHTSEYKENTDNYQKFIKFLNLNGSEKQQFDSLLSYYKAKLYTAIWADKNALAVNQNIPLIHNLVYMDIKHFAGKMNPAKSMEIYADRKDVLSPGEIKKLETALFNDAIPQDYIVVHEDSVYAANFNTVVPQVTITVGKPESNWKDQLTASKMWANQDRVNNIESEKDLNAKYSPRRSNNEVRVTVPAMPSLKEVQQELSKMKELGQLGQMLTFEIDPKSGRKNPIAFKLNFDASKVDSVVSGAMSAVMQFIPKEEREKVKRELDSALAKDRILDKINSKMKEKRGIPVKEKSKKLKLPILPEINNR